MLLAKLCVIIIIRKYAFAKTLPSTGTRGGRDTEYDSRAPLADDDRLVVKREMKIECQVKNALKLNWLVQ